MYFRGTLYGYLVGVYGGVMALTSERIARHRHQVAAGMVRVLLAAVVVVPTLQCAPAAREALATITASGLHASSDISFAVGVRTPAQPGAAAVATSGDGDHHLCSAVVAAAAAISTAAADVVHGLGAVPAVAVIAATALWALWSHSTRGPPWPTTWFLRGGRDRLQHFCVMRR